MLGGLSPSRMLSRMSLQRETSLELRALMFQDAMESFYLLMTHDGREGSLAGGRKSMVESVGEHCGVEVIQQSKSLVVVCCH